jgi:hypothetical protein
LKIRLEYVESALFVAFGEKSQEVLKLEFLLFYQKSMQSGEINSVLVQIALTILNFSLILNRRLYRGFIEPDQ